VISIRRYLNGGGAGDRENVAESGETLLPLVEVLIQGIERYSVEGAPGELTRLRSSTRQILTALAAGAAQEEVLRLAAHAIEALKDHNERAVEHLLLPVIELQAKVKLLAEAITAVGSNSGESIRKLQLIKGQLLATLDVRDIRSLKARLSQYLDGVLAEAERQRNETNRAAEQMRYASQRRNPVGVAREVPVVDAATGFPPRAQAEDTIAQCCEEEAIAFVVIMVINQVETVNQSFGGQFGDVVLRRFATFLREQLPGIDELFRWSGPTVVALMRRKSAPEVRSVIEPLLAQRLFVRNVNPDVQVPVSAHWTVLPLMASPRLLFHKMDSFAGIEHSAGLGG
jgi:GGDEF domain-containing protein